MVFSNLSHHEKDAFFSLMDEYFQSRPELSAKLSGGSNMGNIDVHSAMNKVSSAAHTLGQHMPTPPRRSSPNQPPPDRTPSGLISSKRFGDVDTTSKMSMLTSSISKKKGNPVITTPPPPPAFSAPKNYFAPPPKRTVSADPEPEPEPEAPAGEWAEALYDYDSSESGDLNIKTGQRVLVTEKSSPDWWTGEVNGRSGLFPASYVKML